MDLSKGYVRSIGDIFRNAGIEEIGTLADHSDVVPQPFDIRLMQVEPVHSNLSGGGLVQPLEQSGDGRLPGAGRSDDGDIFAWYQLE